MPTKNLHNHFLAEEAVQEAFLTAFLNLPSLRNLNCFPQWFRSIIVSCIGRSIKQNDLNIPFTDLSEISNIPDTVQSEIDSLDHFKTIHRIHKTMFKLGSRKQKDMQLLLPTKGFRTRKLHKYWTCRLEQLSDVFMTHEGRSASSSSLKTLPGMFESDICRFRIICWPWFLTT